MTIITIIMATFLALCNVQIGDFALKQITSAQINTSWKELGDTATIEIPLASGSRVPDGFKNESIAFRVKDGQTKQMKQGDFVSINLGYQKGLRTWEYNEFKGFVKRISPTRPLQIECEDAVYLFRRVNIKKAYDSVKYPDIKDIVKDIVAQVNAQFKGIYKIKLNYFVKQSVKVDKIRVSNANAAQALQQLKEKVPGMIAFFRPMSNEGNIPVFELYFGLAYVPVDAVVVKYDLDENVHLNDIVYNKAGDKKIRVRASGKNKDNKRVVYDYPPGVSEGELINYKTEIVSDKATLEQIAKKIFEKNSFDGLEGSITGYLVPFARHSQVAKIKATEYDLLNGNFFIDAVATSFGGGGIRRVVSIGKQLS